MLWYHAIQGRSQGLGAVKLHALSVNVAASTTMPTQKKRQVSCNYGRSAKVGTGPSPKPSTKERRNTGVNHPTSTFQLFRVYCSPKALRTYI